MEKSKQSAILQLLDSQVIKAALTGRQPVGPIARSGRRRERMEQSGAATAKQLRVALLVARMEQKEPPQQGIGCHFGGAHQMAPAICLGFGETEQLARSPRRIEPDPPMEWSQQYPHHFHEKTGNIGIAPIHGSAAEPGTYIVSTRKVRNGSANATNEPCYHGQGISLRSDRVESSSMCRNAGAILSI